MSAPLCDRCARPLDDCDCEDGAVEMYEDPDDQADDDRPPRLLNKPGPRALALLSLFVLVQCAGRTSLTTSDTSTSADTTPCDTVAIAISPGPTSVDVPAPSGATGVVVENCVTIGPIGNSPNPNGIVTVRQTVDGRKASEETIPCHESTTFVALVPNVTDVDVFNWGGQSDATATLRFEH